MTILVHLGYRVIKKMKLKLRRLEIRSVFTLMVCFVEVYLIQIGQLYKI